MTNIRLYENPSLKKLTEIFFRIGNTTFGGGYVTIGMLGRELVDTRRWISAEKFDLAFALARVTPGTNLIAFCAAIGALICGVAGAVAAVVALTAAVVGAGGADHLRIRTVAGKPDRDGGHRRNRGGGSRHDVGHHLGDSAAACRRDVLERNDAEPASGADRGRGVRGVVEASGSRRCPSLWRAR